MTGQYSIPIYIDLGATFLFSITGAMVAVRRRYDIVGLFVLAAVTGVGGGIIRDGFFIQDGPPLVLKDARYLIAVGAGCIVPLLFGSHVDRLRIVFLAADALGLGAYAVVGASRALVTGLPETAAVLIGVANACGGGLLRDVLVRDEPLVFKSGQFYALAALVGSGVYVLLVAKFGQPAEIAAPAAIASAFLSRTLSVFFNWKTSPVWQQSLVEAAFETVSARLNPPSAIPGATPDLPAATTPAEPGAEKTPTRPTT